MYQNPENEYVEDEGEFADYPEEVNQEQVHPEDSPEENDGQQGHEEYHDSDEVEESRDQHEEKGKESEHISIRDRLAQAQRDKYQLLHETENLRKELEHARKLSEFSVNSALNQYDENLTRRYADARAMKARAIEEGDVQAQVDADSELAFVTAELYQSKLSKNQQNIEQSQYQYQNTQTQEVPPHVHRWVQENPWFNSASSQYDPELAEAVDLFCNEFDYNLKSNGLGHLVMSPEYLHHVREKAASLMGERNRNRSERGLNMRQSRSPVSPVRNGYSRPSQQRRGINLTSEEKDFATNIMGMSEAEYAKLKIDDIKSGKRDRDKFMGGMR